MFNALNSVANTLKAMLIMIPWNKVLKDVCSRYDSMRLTMCNPAVVCDATLERSGKKALLCHKTAFVNRCPLSVNCLNSLELLKKNMFFDCDNEYEMEKMNHSFNLTKI